MHQPAVQRKETSGKIDGGPGDARRDVRRSPPSLHLLPFPSFPVPGVQFRGTRHGEEAQDQPNGAHGPNSRLRAA